MLGAALLGPVYGHAARGGQRRLKRMHYGCVRLLLLPVQLATGLLTGLAFHLFRPGGAKDMRRILPASLLISLPERSSAPPLPLWSSEESPPPAPQCWCSCSTGRALASPPASVWSRGHGLPGPAHQSGPGGSPSVRPASVPAGEDPEHRGGVRTEKGA